MKVKSLILSWNSDTFCYFFNDLEINIEAVMVFLESMYSEDEATRSISKAGCVGTRYPKFVPQLLLHYISSILQLLHVRTTHNAELC